MTLGEMWEFLRENHWALILVVVALTLVLTVITLFVWNVLEITGCMARRMRDEERRRRGW